MVMMIFITIILDFVLPNITLKMLLNSLLFTITFIILTRILGHGNYYHSHFTAENMVNLLKMLTVLKQGDGYRRVYFTIFFNFMYA